MPQDVWHLRVDFIQNDELLSIIPREEETSTRGEYSSFLQTQIVLLLTLVSPFAVSTAYGDNIIIMRFHTHTMLIVRDDEDMYCIQESPEVSDS